MQIKNPKFNDNILNLIRSLGYIFIEQINEEWNFAKKIGADYPRFHCYAKKNGSDLIINLHLDQKKPSYGGSSAPAGEYNGPLIEQEASQILRQTSLKKN